MRQNVNIVGENSGAGGHSRRGQLFVRLALLPVLLLVVLGWQSAHAQLSITPTTWNIIGLDSNRVTDGPDTFQTGVRVCNTSAARLDNIRSEFFWETTNTFINLNGTSVILWRSLAPGGCVDFYYPITVTRNSNAYFTTRRYYITARADGTPTFSTPRPRELYVEKLLSQGRNDVDSIQGPTSVFVGQVYNYTINANTSTAYNQLESFLNLSNVTYQVLAVSATYSTPGATNDKFYADACGWQTNPTLPNYRSCTGPANFPGGKVGGSVSTTYTVKILGATGTVVAGSLILDFSGGSFHYASGPTLNITVLPSQLTLSKTASTSSTLVGTDVTYTLRATNTGGTDYTLTEFSDTPPAAPAAPAYVANSSTFNGAAIANPTQSGGKLNWTGAFTVPAGQSRDLTYRMTMPMTAGAYVNSAVAFIDYTQIDTTPAPADNAPATSTVNVLGLPSLKLCKTFPGQTCDPAPSLPPQLPGAEITYVIRITNEGGSPARNLTLYDIIPANTDFKVGSVTFDPGTSGIAAPTVAFTNAARVAGEPPPVPNPFTAYAPTGTYDPQVTYVRWTFTANIPAGATAAVSFTVKVR
ncbi:MAG TPA: hypothetical protein VIP46_03495 [Pyrinomonadaceae bacterium]